MGGCTTGDRDGDADAETKAKEEDCCWGLGVRVLVNRVSLEGVGEVISTTATSSWF